MTIKRALIWVAAALAACAVYAFCVLGLVALGRGLIA